MMSSRRPPPSCPECRPASPGSGRGAGTGWSRHDPTRNRTPRRIRTRHRRSARSRCRGLRLSTVTFDDVADHELRGAGAVGASNSGFVRSVILTIQPEPRGTGQRDASCSQRTSGGGAVLRRIRACFCEPLDTRSRRVHPVYRPTQRPVDMQASPQHRALSLGRNSPVMGTDSRGIDRVRVSEEQRRELIRSAEGDAVASSDLVGDDAESLLREVAEKCRRKEPILGADDEPRRHARPRIQWPDSRHRRLGRMRALPAHRLLGQSSRHVVIEAHERNRHFR